MPLEIELRSYTLFDPSYKDVVRGSLYPCRQVL